MTTTTTSSPPAYCRLLVRSKAGLELFQVPERPGDPVPPQRSNPFLLQDLATTFMQPAPDGSAVYVHVSGTGIVKCSLDSSIAQEIATISKGSNNCQPFLTDTHNVQMLHISPAGTFLLTWERWYEDKCPNNLKLWEAASGKLIAAFPQKSLARDAWPYLQWTFDEQYAFLLATNEVRVYPAANLQPTETTASADSQSDVDATTPRYTDKLRIVGLKTISLPQTAPVDDKQPQQQQPVIYYFTSFCPGSKDKPARTALHAYQPSNSSNNKANPYPALLSKSLFQAEEMKTYWSPTNDTALITLQTAVDTSGQSYYGSSQLFLLSAIPSNTTTNDVLAVPLSEEGPVMDVQWMPNPTKRDACFIVVAGRMPSMASLHHGRTGQPLFLFGHAHRNTCAWAPHGRFVCLAGFGNLAGGMGFWDRHKLKLIPGSTSTLNDSLNATGQLRAEAVVGYGWSPDSRSFVVSTCTPRMNVDNGIRLFNYAGQEFDASHLPWSKDAYRPDKLFQAIFVPAKVSVYPDRPQTPPPAPTATADSAPVSSPAATSPSKQVAAPSAAAPKPAGRYVPPSQRGKQGGGTSLAERLRREKEGTLVGATKVTPKAASSLVQQQLNKASAAVVGLAAPDPTAKSKSAQRREKTKMKKNQQQQQLDAVSAATAEATPPDTQTPVSAPAEVDPEKRARKLKKMLKQIDELKTRDPASLNDDQKEKIAAEEQLLQEIKALGL